MGVDMTRKSITVAFIAVIVFCLCYIQAILAKQKNLMSETYELTAKPDDKLKNSTVSNVRQIDGVLEASYYMSASLTLSVNGYSIKLTVYGLDTDYKINDKYTAGSGIILNQAAIDAIQEKYEKNRKDFTDYYSPKYNLGSDNMSNDTNVSQLLHFDLDAVIENKTDDEAAMAYLSINQMSQLMKKLEKNSEASQLLIKLINYTYLTDVKDQLKDLDLTITSNTNTITDESDTYNIHILYLAIILAVSLFAVIGLHKEFEGSVLIIGYFFGTAIAVCLPYLFSPTERSSTVFGLSASSWFYFVVFAVITVIITFKELYIRFTK